uniref:Uncharacterized protein n=1 Tax=Romanomermis culicivorax TaxID=13658 RepID=A0A915I140_ROMCU
MKQQEWQKINDLASAKLFKMQQHFMISHENFGETRNLSGQVGLCILKWQLRQTDGRNICNLNGQKTVLSAIMPGPKSAKVSPLL